MVEWEKAIRISKKVEKRGVLDILIFMSVLFTCEVKVIDLAFDDWDI